MSHEERERLNEIGRQLFYHFLIEVHVSFVNNCLAQLLLNSDAVFEYRNVPGYIMIISFPLMFVVYFR